MASKGSSDNVAMSSDSHEEKEVKKRRFRPLKAVRRLFTMRRKSKTFSSEDSGVNLASSSSRSTSRDKDLATGRHAKPLSKSFSMSADSVFTADQSRRDSQGLHETATSIPDLHIHHSKSKTMSRDSELSLYSMDSSELEEEFFSSSPTSGSFFRSASSLDSSMELDLDAVSPSESLDLSAAKHKAAMRPRQRRKPSKHSQSMKSPKSPPANLTSVSEESPSKMSFSGSRRESEETKEKIESHRASSLEILPSKEVRKEDTEVEAINRNMETKVIMRQKRIGSSSPIEKDKEHQSLLLEMKRKSFNKSLESVTADKELKPRTPSPEQVSEFSKAFDKVKRRSVFTDDKTQESLDGSTNKGGASVDEKRETKVEPKSPGGKISAVNISMFEKPGNTSSPEAKTKKDDVKKREDSPTKGSQPWRSKTAPVDPVAFKVAQSKSSDALSIDKQPLKRVSSHDVSKELKQSSVKVETKRFSVIETSSGGAEPAWISMARKKQKDPEKEEPVTLSLSSSPPISPVPKSSPMTETTSDNSGESDVPAWKAQLKKNKEDAAKAKEKDEAKTESVPPWKRQQHKSPERKVSTEKSAIKKDDRKDDAKTENVAPWKRQQHKSPERKISTEKTAIKKDDQNVPGWKRQSKVQEKAVPSGDSNKTQTTSQSSIVKRFSKNFEEDPLKKTEIIDIKSQKRQDKVARKLVPPLW
ncbi:neurofilament heavy polypeptide-like isoform X2 [Lineus longissimus]|uniref:neurofilament heavy polypeptide-like isoform X2 n=1 Tax=Lineus longissimus TaxID=88925 RepID=UPI002B4F91A0